MIIIIPMVAKIVAKFGIKKTMTISSLMSAIAFGIIVLLPDSFIGFMILSLLGGFFLVIPNIDLMQNQTYSTHKLNPEGEAVLRKYIGPMFENPMFEMAKSFSLKMIQDFDSSIMNDIMLYNISKEINKVKK